MSNHLQEVASDLSLQVLNLRRLKGDLGPCALDSSNRRLYPLPCAIVQREAFIADPEAIHEDTRIFVRERP